MLTFFLVVGFCLALAQNVTDAPTLSRDVCKDDYARFCANEEGRSRCKCIREHIDELTPDCAAYVRAKSAAREEARAACGSDARRLCPQFLGGDYVLLGQCLRANSEKLSEDCSAYVQRKIAEIPSNACDADVTALCSNSSGFSAQLACISTNLGNVSDPCRRLVYLSIPKTLMGAFVDRESSNHYSKRIRRLGKKMCGDDVKEFCSKERENGIEAIRDCLYEHYSELSEKCTSFLDARATGDYSSLEGDDDHHHHHKRKGLIIAGIVVVGLILLCLFKRRCKKRWHERRMRWDQFRQFQMQQEMQMQPTQMMAVPLQGSPQSVSQTQSQPSQQTVMYAVAAPYTGTYSNQLLTASPVAYNP